MNLFLFLLKKKVSFYKSFNNWNIWVIDIIILIFYVFFSYYFSYIYNLDTINLANLNRENLVIFLYISILFSPIFFKIFLSRLDKEFILSEHYPIKKINLVITDFLVFGFLKIRYFIIILSILSISYISSVPRITIINSFIFLLIGVIFTENIINIIILGKKKYYIILSIILFSSIYIAINQKYFNAFLIPLTFLLLIILCFIYYSTYIYSNNIVISNKSKNIRFYFFNIILGNTIFIKSFPLTLIFKIIAFTYFNYQMQKNYSEDIPEFQEVFLYLALPVITFTFIYNNTWGYFKNLAINLVITGSSFEMFLLQFCKLILPALLIDFILSIILLIYFDYFTFLFLILFITFSLYAIIIAFFGSLIKYKQISKAVSFISLKANTSIPINILTLLGIIPFLFIENSISLSYLLIFTPIIFTALLFFLLKKYYEPLIKIFSKNLFNFKSTI